MEKLLPIRVVEELTGYKKSSIYKRIHAGTFPAPIRVEASSRWIASEVEAWVSAKIEHGKNAVRHKTSRVRPISSSRSIISNERSDA